MDLDELLGRPPIIAFYEQERCYSLIDEAAQELDSSLFHPSEKDFANQLLRLLKFAYERAGYFDECKEILIRVLVANETLGWNE